MPNHITKIVNTTVRGSNNFLLAALEDVDSVYETSDFIVFYSHEGLRIGPVITIGDDFQIPGWRTSANREGVGSYTTITEDDKKKIRKLISLRTKIVGYDLMKEERGWG